MGGGCGGDEWGVLGEGGWECLLRSGEWRCGLETEGRGVWG